MLYATVIVGSAFSVVFFLRDLVRRAHGRALAAAGRALNGELAYECDTHRGSSPACGRRAWSRARTCVVVGGGPAGLRRSHRGEARRRSVTLIERYPYLGGLASGGMVLVLDDMHNGEEITVTGLCMEMIERMAKLGAAVYPPAEERGQPGRSTATLGALGLPSISARR